MVYIFVILSLYHTMCILCLRLTLIQISHISSAQYPHVAISYPSGQCGSKFRPTLQDWLNPFCKISLVSITLTCLFLL